MSTSEKPTQTPSRAKSRSRFLVALIGLIALAFLGLIGLRCGRAYARHLYARYLHAREPVHYLPRKAGDLSGFTMVAEKVKPWRADASLAEVRDAWQGIGPELVGQIDRAAAKLPEGKAIAALFNKARLLHYDGKAADAYEVLEDLRARVTKDKDLEGKWLFTIIYAQGVTGLRIGENENCVLCRGDSACILPISPAAVHKHPHGSRLAIKHFTEYLQQFPDDLTVRWLLNLAHMTLGEYPDKVDPRFLVRLDHYDHPEFDIGQFRDIAHLAGVNRFNQAGGACLEDFSGKGLLDLVVTPFDPTQEMAFYRNKGDGTFEERTREAGLLGQVGGGLNCVQTDYNNDGHMDIFIPRGAWIKYPVRPSLLRNNGDGTFTDVTKAAGLDTPMNSAVAAWADFDNDGSLDLFLCGERQPSRLYRNKGDGTFEDVTARSGLPTVVRPCRGGTWIDFDNDGYPDLFLNYWKGGAALFRNNGNGTFTDVTQAMGINGPDLGFSCWAFDYDNDGWPDIFATCYERSLDDVVLGLQGKPHHRKSNRLYRNLGGKGFQDVTKEAGLDMVFATMGSNFGDFDNDGYLDIYLATGAPGLDMLRPNRMFKNVAGKRFAEITASSRTGHLQKGHGVACGDWRRSGNLDLFVEMGGAANGDKYHNVLFLNPGQGNNWLSVKLVGVKTNRPAIGARIKVVTDGPEPLTVYRHVSSGSSFGANPLEQHIGVARGTKVALLEVTWPTSKTTQVFRDLDVNQAVEVTEFAAGYRKLPWKELPTPK